MTAINYVVYVLLGISLASDCGLPTFQNPLSVPSSKAGCGVRSVDSEKMHGIYTRVGVFARAGGPIGDQVVGGSEWVGRSGGGGIKDASGCRRVIVYSLFVPFLFKCV